MTFIKQKNFDKVIKIPLSPQYEKSFKNLLY